MTRRVVIFDAVSALFYLALALFLLADMVSAQDVQFYRTETPRTVAVVSPTGAVLRQGDIEIIPAVYGIPCEPGEMILGLFHCPPIEKQGVMIHVRSDDWKAGLHTGYLVTLNYRTAAGEIKSVTCGGDNPCPTRTRIFGQDWDDGWRAVAFQVGRMAVGPLPGITIGSVVVTKIPPPAAIITIGKTEIGAPK